MLDSAAPTVFQFEALTLGLIVSAAFVTAVFHSVAGFAGGLLLSVCLAPILGIKAVVPVVAVAVMVSNTARLWVFRHAVNWRVYGAIMITAFPGIVVGALVYSYLPVAAIAVILGVFLILAVPLRRVLRGLDIRVGLRGLSAAGSGFGLISGTTIGAGMILVPFLLGAGLAGENLVAIIAAVGFTLNLTKTVVFGSTALLDLNMLLTGLLIGLCTIPGAYTGRWIVTHTPIRIHTLLLDVLITIGGLYFLWSAAKATGTPT
ncbi:MAG: TSUP family transporter [Kiloniellaceae bacterium]